MSQGESRQGMPLAGSVEKLRREFDRWLEVAFAQGEKALDAVGLRNASTEWLPNVDMIETSEEILVDVDLPGVATDGVEVTLAGNMLTIRGTKAVREAGPALSVHQRERSRGKFLRATPLPVPVNPEIVSAELKNGVLQIRLAKSERAKTREIRVRAVSADSASGDGGPRN